MALPVLAALPLTLLLQTPPAPERLDPPGTFRPETPNLVDPALKSQVDPDYPAAVVQAKIRAKISVHIVIGRDGKASLVWVESAEVWMDPARGGGRLDSFSSTLGLDDAALKAARKWLFDPAMLDEKPVPVAWTIVFEFQNGKVTGQLTPPLRAPQAPYAPSVNFAKGIRDELAPGVVAPKILQRVDPKYSSAALRRKMTGDVWLRAVVLADGTVGDVQVIKSLDRVYGLDDAAIEAAKKWTFAPATENGKVIPVVVTMIIEFRLH